MGTVDTTIPSITSTSISTGTTANSTSTQSDTLSQLQAQIDADSAYDTTEEITDINGNSTTVQSSFANAMMTGSGPGKYIVQMNGKKYSIDSKNAKKAASYVYRNRYRNKYILLYVNKMNNKNTQVFRGICYKNNKKIVKEVNF
jgi:hypothetical protein